MKETGDSNGIARSTRLPRGELGTKMGNDREAICSFTQVE